MAKKVIRKPTGKRLTKSKAAAPDATTPKHQLPPGPQLELQPPTFRTGEWKDEYTRASPFYELSLDHGAFLFLWDYVYRKATGPMRQWIGPELQGVFDRAAEAFDVAARRHEEFKVQAEQRLASAGTKKIKKRGTKKRGK